MDAKQLLKAYGMESEDDYIEYVKGDLKNLALSGIKEYVESSFSHLDEFGAKEVIAAHIEIISAKIHVSDDTFEINSVEFLSLINDVNIDLHIKAAMLLLELKVYYEEYVTFAERVVKDINLRRYQ